MFYKHGLRSAARMPGRTALTFLLVGLVAALLGTSLGLTWSVSRTLEDCRARYTTLAVPEYSTGESETDPAEIARLTEALERAALPDGVLSWEPSRVAQGILPEMEGVVNAENARTRAVLVIKVVQPGGFVPWEDGEMTHEVVMDDGQVYPVSNWQPAEALVTRVLFSRVDVDGKRISLGEESHTDGLVGSLEPGYYLVCGAWEASWSSSKTLLLDRSLPPLGLDDPGDLESGDCAPYLRLAGAMELLLRSVTVRAVEHLTEQFPFQQQLIHLEEGRAFTAEEARGGAQVCVVPARLARENGWALGDSIHLGLSVRENSPILESYDPERGFDKEGEYTVVGIFSANDVWNATIYIPVPTDLDMTVNHCDSVLGQWRLRNGAGNDFLAGCQGVLPAGIHLRLYDQGYDATVRPLAAMLRIVGLISLACLLAGGGFLLLTAWLYVRAQRGAGGLMVRLGASTRNVITYYLAGLGSIAVPAAAAGTIVSALATRQIAGLMNGVLAESAQRNLSFSADKLMLQENHAVSIGAAGPLLYGLIALAVVALTLLLGGHFARRTVPRQRPRPVRQRRQSRVKTRTLAGGAAKYAWLSAARGGFRTAAAVLAPLCAAVLLCLLVTSVDNCRGQLDALRRDSTVRGYFTDWSGAQLENTPAKTSDFLDVLDMDETVQGTATQNLGNYKYAGRYDAETKTTYWGDLAPEENDKPTEADKTFLAGEKLYLPQVIAATALTDAPQFAYTGAPETTWLPGWDESFLAADETTAMEWVEMTDEEIADDPALQMLVDQSEGYRPTKAEMHPVPCVVSTAFLERTGLALGDQCLVRDNEMKLNYGMGYLLQIVGSYKRTAGRDNIYVPISQHWGFSLDHADDNRELLEGKTTEERIPGGIAVSYEDGDTELRSAVFTFRCDDLAGLKEHLRDLGLSQVRQLDGNRKPFVLEDGVFQASQQSLQQRLWYMERIFPVAAALTLTLALVLSYLLTLARRRELWLMRCMGTSAMRSFFSIYLEQLVLCLLGGMLGLAACRILHTWNETGLRQTGLFAALWLLGALMAALSGMSRMGRREG